MQEKGYAIDIKGKLRVKISSFIGKSEIWHTNCFIVSLYPTGCNSNHRHRIAKQEIYIYKTSLPTFFLYIKPVTVERQTGNQLL